MFVVGESGSAEWALPVSKLDLLFDALVAEYVTASGQHAVLVVLVTGRAFDPLLKLGNLVL